MIPCLASDTLSYSEMSDKKAMILVHQESFPCLHHGHYLSNIVIPFTAANHMQIKFTRRVPECRKEKRSEFQLESSSFGTFIAAM